MGEWHLYKPSDSLGDKLCHQSECSYQVHLQRVPPSPANPPPPSTHSSAVSLTSSAQAWPYPALPLGGQKGNQRTHGKAEKTGCHKAPASQDLKQSCGLKSSPLQSACLPGWCSGETVIVVSQILHVFSCSCAFVPPVIPAQNLVPPGLQNKCLLILPSLAGSTRPSTING